MDLENFSHAFDAACFVVNNSSHAAKDRRMSNNRHFHSRKIEIEAKFQRTITFRMLSSRLTFLPTSRNSAGFFKRTVAGTGLRAASLASSA